ncbi:porin [Acidocella sp. MX-AZ03]|uniref:outer membrane beta-barrel protein n=1 Tax=Acidocella sp. MX-AZ03 TaxID=2697363 RepID=UPI0022DD2453|nr:outer membrane beta-barrel protein [Acidocella sp. MX-AZ03]WBO59179.1 porin [Acidocella sp. MX-AZ03]
MRLAGNGRWRDGAHPPAGIEIDGAWLGNLTLSGGADGYGFVQSGTSHAAFNGNNITGTRLANALIELQKPAGLVQFNLAIGANTGAMPLGSAPIQASVNSLATGPLYYGYLTIAPPGSPVTLSAGQLISLEGFEAGTDWYNSNLFTSALFYTQSAMFRGAELNYASKALNATIAWGMATRRGCSTRCRRWPPTSCRTGNPSPPIMRGRSGGWG